MARKSERNRHARRNSNTIYDALGDRYRHTSSSLKTSTRPEGAAPAALEAMITHSPGITSSIIQGDSLDVSTPAWSALDQRSPPLVPSSRDVDEVAAHRQFWIFCRQPVHPFCPFRPIIDSPSDRGNSNAWVSSIGRISCPRRPRTDSRKAGRANSDIPPHANFGLCSGVRLSPPILRTK